MSMDQSSYPDHQWDPTEAHSREDCPTSWECDNGHIVGSEPRSGRREHSRLFRLLTRLHVPAPAYYWLLDRLTDNDGWRPLHMRYPEHFRGDK